MLSSGSETPNTVQVQQLPAEASGRLQRTSQEQIAYESKYQELITFHQSQEALDTNTVLLAPNRVTLMLKTSLGQALI